MLNPIRTHSESGGRSLLSSGIILYNRYLTDWVRDGLAAVCGR